LTLCIKIVYAYLQYARINCSTKQKYDKMADVWQTSVISKFAKSLPNEELSANLADFCIFYVIFMGLAR
jgi:hypothetical protein